MPTLTVQIEVTEEQLRAGNFKFSPHEPTEVMSPEEMVRFHLEPALRAKVQTLEDYMRWTEGEYYNLPRLNPSHHHVSMPRQGTQICYKPSPTPRCWYDDQKDPRWDSCLFCGEPHERK